MEGPRYRVRYHAASRRSHYKPWTTGALACAEQCASATPTHSALRAPKSPMQKMRPSRPAIPSRSTPIHPQYSHECAARELLRCRLWKKRYRRPACLASLLSVISWRFPLWDYQENLNEIKSLFMQQRQAQAHHSSRAGYLADTSQYLAKPIYVKKGNYQMKFLTMVRMLVCLFVVISLCCSATAQVQPNDPGDPPNFPGCSLSVFPGFLEFASPGGTQSVSVSTQSTCGWQASCSAPLSGGGSGVGPGSFTVQAPPNPGPSTVTTSCTVFFDSASLGIVVLIDAPMSNTAVMQRDGNFVVFGPTGTPIFSTGTANTGAAIIRVQDDGNLVLYAPVWFAGTAAAPSPGPFPVQTCKIATLLHAPQFMFGGQCITSPKGQYFLYMGTDGNFFIYDLARNTGTWDPGTTNGNPGAFLNFQPDGNLVVYNSAGTVGLWNSVTSGSGADLLNMEDNGQIILYRPVWNTQTSQGWDTNTYSHPSCDVGPGTGWTGAIGIGQCFVSPNGRYELLLQSNDHLVLLDLVTNQVLWTS